MGQTARVLLQIGGGDETMVMGVVSPGSTAGKVHFVGMFCRYFPEPDCEFADLEMRGSLAADSASRWRLDVLGTPFGDLHLRAPAGPAIGPLDMSCTGRFASRWSYASETVGSFPTGAETLWQGTVGRRKVAPEFPGGGCNSVSQAAVTSVTHADHGPPPGSPNPAG